MSEISYELAKKLKEAGFHLHSNDMHGHVERRPEPENHIYYPTLSELIDQIRKEYPQLQWRIRMQSNGVVIERFNWPDMKITENAEEAVANLYIALHGNS